MVFKLLVGYTRRDSAHGSFPLQEVLTTLHYLFLFENLESVRTQLDQTGAPSE